MTITEAVRRRLVVVFCARCQWKLVDCDPRMINDKCPTCRKYGLDSVVPHMEQPVI